MVSLIGVVQNRQNRSIHDGFHRRTCIQKHVDVNKLVEVDKFQNASASVEIITAVG
jgi:hypothetical protein